MEDMDIEDLSLDWSPSHIVPSGHCPFLCVAVPPSDLDHISGEKCSIIQTCDFLIQHVSSEHYLQAHQNVHVCVILSCHCCDYSARLCGAFCALVE